MSNKITIGITGTGSLIGQAIIKSIKNSELSGRLNLIGFDYFEDTVGSFWCNSNHLLPDILKPDVSELIWLAALLDYVKLDKIKLLFVGVDFELPVFARHKELIEKETGAKVVVSSENVIGIGDDKYLTYEFLKENKLYYPRSFLPSEIDQMNLEYPVIIKPRRGARSVGVSLVSDKEELVRGLGQLVNPIIQERIGTEDTEFTCGTIFLNDSLKASIALRRTLKEGNTYISRFSKDFPDIIQSYINDIACILKPFGSCNFQLRLDGEGIPKLFEINPRHSGTTYIRSLFGYKEVEYIISYLLFDLETRFSLKEGVVVRYYDEFFVENQ
ncbi:MAG: ATP-grasp domain-containing protein [Candidatus Methylumidiphilus sp.]